MILAWSAALVSAATGSLPCPVGLEPIGLALDAWRFESLLILLCTTRQSDAPLTNPDGAPARPQRSYLLKRRTTTHKSSPDLPQRHFTSLLGRGFPSRATECGSVMRYVRLESVAPSRHGSTTGADTVARVSTVLPFHWKDSCTTHLLLGSAPPT